MSFNFFNYSLKRPINSVFKDFFQRKTFNVYRPKNIVPDFLLETFECAKEDKFLLYSEDFQESPAYQCRFCPKINTNIALIAKEDGGIVMVNTALSGSRAIVQNFKAHRNCIFDAQWMGSERIITSSGDWSIKYIDLNREQAISQLNSHAGSVKTLALRPDHPNMFASSSRDGSILLWDLNDKSKYINDDSGVISINPINSIFNAHHPEISASTTNYKSNKKKLNTSPKPVTSTIFVNENVLASGGSADGQIKLWDIRKIGKKNPEPIQIIPYSGKLENSPGYTDLIVNSTGTMLFAYCKDKFIYQYDLQRTNYNIPVYQYTGHLSSSYYLKMDLSPDDNYLACGSSSYSPYIYHVGLVPQHPVLLNGHKGEVTACRWCPTDPSIIMSISDDCTAMVHRMKPGSEYNVFYRNQIMQGTLNFAPISLSSRSGEETVNERNQYQKNNIHHEENPNVHSAKMCLNKSIILSTPQKTKNQSIKSFLSPIATTSLFQENIHQSPLIEKNINFPLQTKIDRVKSVFVKSSGCRSLPEKRKADPGNDGNTNSNKENLKRRKTSVQPIGRYFQLENDDKN